MNTYLHDENIPLKEILNNINTGLYEIQDINNIRISCIKKPDFIILTSELDASENIVKFFESENYFNKNKNKIIFEKTFYDYFVVNIINEEFLSSNSISLFELIISSEFLSIDDDDKWNLELLCNCTEINYDIENDTINNNKIDMKLFG